MAEVINLPNKVVNADWQDDIDDADFMPYPQEADYISKNRVSRESLERIMQRNIKLGILGLEKKLAA